MVNDLIGGHIDFAFLDAGAAVAQSKAGKVRILAVTSSARSASLPDIPTMGEAGYPRVEIMPWWGVFVPKDTPQPVIDKLAGLFKQITALPETKPLWLASRRKRLRVARRNWRICSARILCSGANTQRSRRSSRNNRTGHGVARVTAGTRCSQPDSSAPHRTASGMYPLRRRLHPVGFLPSVSLRSAALSFKS